MGTALIRPVSSIAWELRSAWASGRRVALSLQQADMARLEGIVRCVSATDSFVAVQGRKVPLDRVLAVHWPSRLGDSRHRRAEGWTGAGHAPAVAGAQMTLPVDA